MLSFDNITVNFTRYWCHSSAAHAAENLTVKDAAVFRKQTIHKHDQCVNIPICHVCTCTCLQPVSPDSHFTLSLCYFKWLRASPLLRLTGHNMFLHISIQQDIIDTLIVVRRLLPFVMCDLVSCWLTVISSYMQPSLWSSLSRVACYSTNNVNRPSKPKGKWLVYKEK